MEHILELFYENVQWIFSGIGVPLLGYYLFKKPTNKEKANSDIPSKNIEMHTDFTKQHASKGVKQEDLYKSRIGKKHRWLRETVLKIKLREMAKFYSLDNVSQLEHYESGEEELPFELIAKLEQFFFLKPDFLDTDESLIFRTFNLSQPSLNELFDEGFWPTIACCPYDRHHLYCFIVMHKEEAGLKRIIVSDLVGSFVSSGGGRMNIQYLIDEMIERNIPASKISILTTSEYEWEKLQSDSYYDTRLFHGLGAADWDCMDIFQKWYQETTIARKEYGT